MSPRTKKTAPPKVETDGLDELSDDELAAKVAERYPDYDAEKIAEAVANHRDEVIADLRSGDDNGEDTPDGEEPEIGDRHPIADAPVADTAAEFPTEWHRDQYVSDLGREIDGAKLQVEELTAMGDAISPDALAEAQERVDNAKAELARVKKAK